MKPIFESYLPISLMGRSCGGINEMTSCFYLYNFRQSNKELPNQLTRLLLKTADKMCQARIAILALMALVVEVYSDSLALYPQQTETRQVQSLDGVWNFKLGKAVGNGIAEKWFENSLDLVSRSF